MLEDGSVEPFFIYDRHGESRTNYLIVEKEPKNAALVSDKGSLPTQEQVQSFCEMMCRTIQPGDYLVFSGDTSNFPDPDIYNKLTDLLTDRSLRIFPDASGRIFESSLKKSPFLIKPNADELSTLLGRKLVSEADMIGAISELDKYNIEVAAVSLDGEGSIVRAWDKLYRIRPPEVNVYNTVGCGDCYLGGLLHGFECGMNIEDTLRYATAVSAATAESALSLFFDVDRANELIDQVEIKKI